eukprot:scaffold165182_cov45-Attheya_sp.AAC.2
MRKFAAANARIRRCECECEYSHMRMRAFAQLDFLSNTVEQLLCRLFRNGVCRKSRVAVVTIAPVNL